MANDILNDLYYGQVAPWEQQLEGHCQPDCVNVRIKFTNPSHAPKANQAYRE